MEIYTSYVWKIYTKNLRSLRERKNRAMEESFNMRIPSFRNYFFGKKSNFYL